MSATPQKSSLVPSLMPCSCGSVVFEKTTEMRGHVVDLLTITRGGVKTKRIADKVRVEREPKSVTCSSCGKRNSVPSASLAHAPPGNPKP